MDTLQAIVDLSAGWDGEGSTGPKPPMSWESVGRLAMDYARAALAERTQQEANSTAPMQPSVLQALLDHVDRETCIHETTHRGGGIWTICDACDRKWADDEGGFVPYEDPPAVAAARAALAAPTQAPMQPSYEQIDELLQDHAKGSREMHDFARSVLALAAPTQAVGGEIELVNWLASENGLAMLSTPAGREAIAQRIAAAPASQAAGGDAFNCSHDWIGMKGTRVCYHCGEPEQAAAVEPKSFKALYDKLEDTPEYAAIKGSVARGETEFTVERAAAAPEGLTEREPWLLYLIDRADGVKGRYAVARWNPAGYREVWNLRGHGWGAYSDDVLTLEQAHELLRTARFGPATPDAKTAEERKPLADIEICEATFDISLNDFDQMTDFKIAIARAVLGIGGQP